MQPEKRDHPDTELDDLLKETLRGWGCEISQAQVVAFRTYRDELRKWNASLNITAIEGNAEIVVKHFIDSLTPLPYLPPKGFVLDIGTGGGFPGLPLKIASPSLCVLLLDSSHKKVSFLKNLIRVLGLRDIDALAQRAEAKGFQEVMKETVDVVISRAAFSLEAFVPLGVPYLKKDGVLVAMRGRHGAQEARDGRVSYEKFRLHLEMVREVSLPLDMGDRALVFLKKL